MKSVVFIMIKAYRLCVSPFLGDCCRFYPSCSAYAEEALKKYGFFKGSWLAIKRVVKCGPWNQGGVDFP